MKTLHNHTLIYDKDCPMCVGYTSLFLKTGMLDEKGREPFTQMSKKTQSVLDTERAADEIALVDTKTGDVLYGIDSMLKVMGNAFSPIAIIGNWKPINFLLKKLYKFISYNRKVIIPSKTPLNSQLQCVPTFNNTYRWIYILFTILVTGFILNAFGSLLANYVPKGGLWREFAIASGQIVAQSLVLYSFDKKIIVNYLGNMMTISLAGSLLLSLYLIVNLLLQLPTTLGLMWFGIVVTLMLLEHIRRVKLLKLPSLLTLSWVFYRIIVLTLILL